MIDLRNYDDLTYPSPEPLLEVVFKRLLEIGEKHNDQENIFEDPEIVEQMEEADDVLERSSCDHDKVRLAQQLLEEMRAT